MNELWSLAAGALDALGRLGPWSSAAFAGLVAAATLAWASALQRHLVQTLAADPRARVSWGRLELLFSLPGLLLLPFRLLYRGVRWLALRLGGRARKSKGKASAAEPAPEPADEPLLVASLGPTFLLGALAAVALYLLTLPAGVLLRARLELPAGSPVWQVLLLGHRPETGLFLPLERHSPWGAALLAVGFWTLVGWWTARGARILFQESLGRNLAQDRDDTGVLRFWRRYAGAASLARPDDSYRHWAAWVVAAGVPLLAWAWLSLDGSPFRVGAAEAGLAFMILLFWAIHLLLRGLERLPARPAEEEKEGTEANGWSDVLAHLRRHLQVPEPLAVQAPRPVEPLQLTQLPPEMDGVISPLVLDLLPAPHRLTAMQRLVLTDLSLQSFVHVDPPLARETLELAGPAEEVLQDRSRLRHRNQVVLANESSGKTTLALLAAANHVLVHTRSALLVARDDAHEERLYRALRERIDPSTVRWNLRVRQMGGDLMNDLARGIVPDVVVCSLQRLVVHLLGNAESFSPFLRTLGLVVVDDVESYSGPVEVHAQLAFRRLAARLRQLLGVGGLGERGAPLVLVLGGDSLHDVPAWARTLCGIDAVTRDFTRGTAEMEEREAAEAAARGVTVRPAGEGETAAEAAASAANLQVFYRLRDFRAATGELLTAGQLVEACERLSVPWIYRPCGDSRRHLGRRPLLLKDEPRCCVEAPEDACVVFLEGRWSDVRRERRRLRRAGARFRRQRGGEADAAPREGGGEAVAFILLVDADEDMAFTQLDCRFGLAEVLERLPEPVLRPPSGRVVLSHLAADLVQHWMEVAEVVEVFGHTAAPVLRRLSRGGVLLAEPRVDVHPDAYEYVRKLYVRALARATAPRLGDRGLPSLLPTPVAEVEVVSRRSVAVRDRTRPALPLARVDAAASAFLYYPGRIFTDARGSFVVAGRAAEEDDSQASPLEAGDVLVEPILTDDVSSPRRRVECRFDLTPEEAASLDMETSAPQPVLYGRRPLRVGVLGVEARPRHLATLRVGPVFGEVRQRLAAEERGALPLLTTGLWIEPNPAGMPPGEELTFGAARLLAAALRVVLPNLLRGAAESLEVALVVDGGAAEESPLRPGEGFLLLDLDEGGSGAARALLRDGVEPLLRLCRLLLERVLDPSRLLALHDHQGGPDGAETEAEGAGIDPRAGVERHAGMRRQALVWLDSRLRREGRADGVPGSTGQAEGGFQAGEGDVIDLGRVWYGRDGAVGDLVWMKHRWRVPGGREAMLDVAFDRATAAAARVFSEDAERLGRYRELHAAVLGLPERRLADGTVWGAPRPVLVPSADRKRAEVAAEGVGHPALAHYHPLAEAIAAQAGGALDELAAALLRAGGEAGGLELLRYLCHFVQGISYSIPDAVRGGLRPPVSTLLYRLGDCDSKSLLLALLARSCGIDAGLFVSFPEGHAMAAVTAVTGSGTWSGEAERPVPPPLADWCALAGLPGPPAFWAEMPVSREPGAEVAIYVPVESTVYSPVGRANAASPRTWAFLPLTVAPLGLPELPGDPPGVERKDLAEREDRS